MIDAVYKLQVVNILHLGHIIPLTIQSQRHILKPNERVGQQYRVVKKNKMLLHPDIIHKT